MLETITCINANRTDVWNVCCTLDAHRDTTSLNFNMSEWFLSSSKVYRFYGVTLHVGQNRLFLITDLTCYNVMFVYVCLYWPLVFVCLEGIVAAIQEVLSHKVTAAGLGQTRTSYRLGIFLHRSNHSSCWRRPSATVHRKVGRSPPVNNVVLPSVKRRDLWVNSRRRRSPRRRVKYMKHRRRKI